MTPFDSHSRDQLRRLYADAWRRHRTGVPLAPLEALITDVIGAHPEYHSLVADDATAIAFEQPAQAAAQNPFLHMGLHLAIREQVSIDRPPGIRGLHDQLQLRFGELHAADHVLMEALGETLWEAQRNGCPPDEADYLARARRRLTAVRRR